MITGVWMKNRVILLCFTTCLVGQSALAAKEEPVAAFNWRAAPTEEQIASLTLRDAILRAFARNPKISEAAAQIRVGEAELDAAKSAWYPQVSLAASGGRSHQTDSSGSLNNSGSGGITLSQLLYDFGRTGGNRRAAQAVRCLPLCAL